VAFESQPPLWDRPGSTTSQSGCQPALAGLKSDRKISWKNSPSKTDFWRVLTKEFAAGFSHPKRGVFYARFEPQNRPLDRQRSRPSEHPGRNTTLGNSQGFLPTKVATPAPEAAYPLAPRDRPAPSDTARITFTSPRAQKNVSSMTGWETIGLLLAARRSRVRSGSVAV